MKNNVITKDTSSQKETNQHWALVGARTTAERQALGQGLTLYRTATFDVEWMPLGTLALTNPSFQVINRDRTRVYTVHGDLSHISVIGLEPSGTLAVLQTTSSGGRNPVHLCLTPDEKFLLITNYASGNLVCLPVRADGLLDEPSGVVTFQGTPGPKTKDQKGSHPHQVVHWPGSAWYLVPDKGLDQLHTVRLSPTGQLEQVSTHAAPPGSGPRHLALSADQRLLWLCLELGSAVTRWGFDPGNGLVLTPTQGPATISTLPDAHEGDNSAAGIVLHPLGHQLYVSNRGHDSVCTIATTDHPDGWATSRHWTRTGGSTPRFIALTPEADALIVANEGSHEVLHFPLDNAGIPTAGTVVARTGSPVCVSLV